MTQRISSRFVRHLPDNVLFGGVLSSYRYYGATTAYGDCTVIGNPLFGLIRVWYPSSPTEIGVLNVQHQAHRNVVPDGDDRFTYWTLPLVDYLNPNLSLTAIARSVMQELVDMVQAEEGS